MSRSNRWTGGVLAALFLALHLPFLPPSLEDLDSINFALGVRDYDVSRHQPHPPGYPVFILAAKVLHRFGLSEVHALSLLSVLGGALAIFALRKVFGELERDRPGGPYSWLAVLMVVTCPLYWLTAARPLSDVAGLAAALGVQALILTARDPQALAIAAALAAFAAGIRSQVVWLTFPLLLLGVLRLPTGSKVRGLFWVGCAAAVGMLAWVVPLVIVSGGPQAYWRAFSNQGAEDLSNIAMLATTPSVRLLVRTLESALLVPWGYWQIGVVVLVLASLGLLQMLRSGRSGLITLMFAFGPYLAFDFLFQEAITTRYALPLVIPVGYLAVRGASVMPRVAGVSVIVILLGFSTVIDDRSLAQYARMDAPAFRMLGDMSLTGHPADGVPPAPVLAMHRRDEFDMRRPIQWVGDRMPVLAGRLPAPPKHEWMELVKYWNGGGRNPVWFVADPLRSDLALFRYQQHPSLYRWPLTLTTLIGGARPNEMDWHTIDAPDWYLGEGWAITPETAGIAREDHRGPGYGPITAWVKRRPGPMTLMIGGRNLTGGGTPARVRVAVDGQQVDELTVPPGFFLQMVTVPQFSGAGDYGTVTIESDSRELAIEQFDAEPAGRVVFGFGDGWNEQEYNPSTGVLWRWASDRSVIRLRAEGHAVALTLRGEVEADSSSHVVIRAGDKVVDAFDSGRSFERTVIIPAAAVAGEESTIVLESSAWYVPAEKRWRSRDQRRLGLKVFECQVTPAS